MIRSVVPSVLIVVDEATKIGEARRRSIELATRLGFDEAGQATIALIVTEAASNLVKHSRDGRLILEGHTQGPAGARFEIVTMDSGPGMHNLSGCLADGYSTAGSPGTGMGAMNRLAAAFEVYTQPEKGTILRACLESAPPGPKPLRQPIDLGVVRVCAPGEILCGDDWAIVERDGQCFILVVDGLGHGHPAAAAAEEAVAAFHAQHSPEPDELIAGIHRAIRGTRGAALAIARIDPNAGKVRYSGVGNIAGVIADAATGQQKSLVSFNGTVGHTIRKIQSFDYEWTKSSLLFMHSDGMTTHWSLESFPGILQYHPELIAGALYRDFSRGRDDVCILAARLAEGERM
jgi:anti-sigma regulatory factor (Ser/Thr protein kinase)